MLKKALYILVTRRIRRVWRRKAEEEKEGGRGGRGGNESGSGGKSEGIKRIKGTVQGFILYFSSLGEVE